MCQNISFVFQTARDCYPIVCTNAFGVSAFVSYLSSVAGGAGISLDFSNCKYAPPFLYSTIERRERKEESQPLRLQGVCVSVCVCVCVDMERL